MSAMVITCPDCATSYKTATEAIGANGRTVRCAKCKETWFVPSPDAVALDEDLQADGPVLAEVSANKPSDQPALFEERGGRIVPPAPVVPATAVPAAAPTADVVLRDRADAAKLARRRRTIRLIWIIAALLALAAVVTAYLNRQEIVNRQPKAATLYQALGVDVRENGLEIDPPILKTGLVDGMSVIRIEGAVRNLSADPVSLPLIELTLHDTTGAELAQWFVEPSQATLPGRGRLPFTTEYTDPPAEVTGLRYRFASRAG